MSQKKINICCMFSSTLPYATECEVQMNLAYIDCMGHNDLYKDNCAPTGVEFKTGDCEEPNYISR